MFCSKGARVYGFLNDLEVERTQSIDVRKVQYMDRKKTFEVSAEKWNRVFMHVRRCVLMYVSIHVCVLCIDVSIHAHTNGRL